MITTTNNEDAIKIIECLADEQSRKILGMTSKKEYSAIELSDLLNTSISTMYRKIKLLVESGLIQHVKTVINLRGNEEKSYRCVIREVKVSFKCDELSVSLEKEDYSDKYIRFWKRLAHSNSKEIEHE